MEKAGKSRKAVYECNITSCIAAFSLTSSHDATSPGERIESPESTNVVFNCCQHRHVRFNWTKEWYLTECLQSQVFVFSNPAKSNPAQITNKAAFVAVGQNVELILWQQHELPTATVECRRLPGKARQIDNVKSTPSWYGPA